MRSAQHRYLAQRLPKERAQSQRAASERREHERGQSQGRSEGYNRARAEFTQLLVAKPGEHVAIDPPSKPFVEVLVPRREPLRFRLDYRPSLLVERMILRFEYEEMRYTVAGRDRFDDVTLCWWVPKLRGVE